jgi:membrane dipeptidase
MNQFYPLSVIFLSLLISCSGVETNVSKPELLDPKTKLAADSLAAKFIIADGHVDLPYRLKEIKFNFLENELPALLSSSSGDFDFERAKKGGLDAPFMSIYIPSTYQKKPDGGKALADSLIDMVGSIVKAHPTKFSLARTPAEIEENTRQGKISLPMGMENGAPIGTDLKNVKYFFDRGIRYVTLTHRLVNQICDSSYDTARVWNGLSPFGEEVVREMNRVGIMVDISHVSDSTFYDVMRITKVPAVATHSSCRFFTPGFERNMSDDMIKVLAKNGGVININFGANFLDSTARLNEPLRDSIEAILIGKKLTSRDAEGQAIIASFGRSEADLYSHVERVADHIDHVVKIAGIDHVGIGSDFDGVGDSLPVGLKEVSDYPNLIGVLLKRGYSSEDIEKICSKNLFRVWNKVIEAANNPGE